jgi:predicted TIM-barrel fold metal-dependent hydrolase
MDEVGIEKSVILSYATGAKFDSIQAKYSKYGKRFEVWCGFDFTGKNEAGWSERAVKELERCYKAGARGIGELGDKGLGEFYSRPTPGYIHIDDPRMKPLLQKCAELKMPVNIHVAEPYWMYEPMDSTNDGLMNAYKWRIDKSKGELLDHAELIKTLENAVNANPKTTFIACHFANSEYNLDILGALLDKYPNLYADISARYGETTSIPRYMNAFYKKYQNRLLYGTDMGMDSAMYRTTFRILETLDEHFYEFDLFNYHWPCNGFGLDNTTLQKVYRSNALKILIN